MALASEISKEEVAGVLIHMTYIAEYHAPFLEDFRLAVVVDAES